MHDLIIVGQGPAGISAAIYAVRAGLDVLLTGRDHGALEKADLVENYFGFPEPIRALDLLQRGLDQAERLGVKVIQAEVTGITWNNHFEVDSNQGTWQSDSVILASGMPRRKSSLAGLSSYEGKGVSYCAVCDGFFYRGKTVAVLGNGDYAFKEASELLPFTSSITILTNGRPFEATESNPAIKVRTDKILRLEGDDEKVRRLIFEGDAVLEIDGVFVAEGTASALDLAMKLGLDNDGKAILVNHLQETNLPGLFAAGDCTGGLLQIAVAVGEGAQAGMSAAGFVRKMKGGKEPTVQWGSK